MSKMNIIQQPKKLALAALAALLAVIVLFNLALTVDLLRRDTGSAQFSLSILRAIDNLHKPLVIEPVSGKAYLPEAKLVLPPNQNLSLVYQYSPRSSEASEEILLGSQADMGVHESALITSTTAPEALKATAKLQACVRGVLISFQPVDRHLNAAGTKQLANGSTAYFYTEPSCPNTELLNYANQINSY